MSIYKQKKVSQPHLILVSIDFKIAQSLNGFLLKRYIYYSCHAVANEDSIFSFSKNLNEISLVEGGGEGEKNPIDSFNLFLISKHLIRGVEQGLYSLMIVGKHNFHGFSYVCLIIFTENNGLMKPT